MAPAKKRHHFVPIGYLSRWCDAEKRVWAYRAEAPTEPTHPVPKQTGVEGHYYSRPLDDGTMDTNSLEDFFNTVETPWPPIVDRMIARQNVTPDKLDIYKFMMAQRVRVPSARDAAEQMLTTNVEALFKFMLDRGMLPPPPPELEGHLDKFKVAIAPWKTLEAMAPMAKGFTMVVDHLGFEIVHLRTNSGMTFITSDNPVIYFDPDVDPDRVMPYRPSPSGNLELLFPVGPLTLIRGRRDLKFDFTVNGFRHVDMADRREAMRVNKLIARFAHRLMFAQDRSHDRLIAKHASTSAVVEGRVLAVDGGEMSINTTVFGPKKPKVPWEKTE